MEEKYVKFYGPNDYASGYELERAEVVLDNYQDSVEYTDVNRFIELYNIHRYIIP